MEINITYKNRKSDELGKHLLGNGFSTIVKELKEAKRELFQRSMYLADVQPSASQIQVYRVNATPIRTMYLLISTYQIASAQHVYCSIHLYLNSFVLSFKHCLRISAFTYKTALQSDEQPIPPLTI
jgi:hypothetical protein